MKEYCDYCTQSDPAVVLQGGSNYYTYHYEDDDVPAPSTSCAWPLAAQKTVTASGNAAFARYSGLFAHLASDRSPSLYYYGLRFYSPGLGRWISHDPMGEAGGINLFVTIRNDTVNRADLVGLTETFDFLYEKAKKMFGAALTLKDFQWGLDQYIAAKLKTKEDVLASATKEYGLTEAVQFRLLKNFLGFGTFEDPLKLSVDEVKAVDVFLNLMESSEFAKDVTPAGKAGVATFSKHYAVSARANLGATLNAFTAQTDANVKCVEVSINGKPKMTWVADGQFTVDDTYDFNYSDNEAQRALTDLMANGKALSYTGGTAGLYDGTRNIKAELGVLIMFRVGNKIGAKTFKVTSDPVKFIQNAGDKHATLTYK